MAGVELKKVKEEKEFTVYSERIVEKDEKTGEILKDTSVDVIKAKRRDNFIKIFVTNLDFLGANLSNAERQVLVGLLTRVDYQNIVYIHSELRKDLEKKYSISQATITAGIKGLKEKKVLLELTNNLQEKLEIYSNNAFLINPDIAGKGSFNELKKLRQEISIEYNFDNLEIKRSYYTKSEYDGFSEIQNSPDSHEIKQITQTKNENSDNIKVIVDKKEPAYVETEIVSNTQNSEYEILKLKIASQEAENEKLRLQIKLAKLQNKKEPTLFDEDMFEPYNENHENL